MMCTVRETTHYEQNAELQKVTVNARGDVCDVVSRCGLNRNAQQQHPNNINMTIRTP
jgi:hypothetical protein